MAEVTEIEKKQQLAASDQSFWANVKKQFKKNRVAVFALKFIVLLVAIAIFADFFANDKPLIAKYKGNTYFP